MLAKKASPVDGLETRRRARSLRNFGRYRFESIALKRERRRGSTVRPWTLVEWKYNTATNRAQPCHFCPGRTITPARPVVISRTPIRKHMKLFVRGLIVHPCIPGPLRGSGRGTARRSKTRWFDSRSETSIKFLWNRKALIRMSCTPTAFRRACRSMCKSPQYTQLKGLSKPMSRDRDTRLSMIFLIRAISTTRSRRKASKAFFLRGKLMAPRVTRKRQPRALSPESMQRGRWRGFRLGRSPGTTRTLAF